jgi:prepilin-type N-terminal cleavage/methylation domain-containing protein
MTRRLDASIMDVSPKKIKGFTLLELIISSAIITIVMSVGIPVTLQFVRSYGLQSERDTVLVLLEWARDQSMANHLQTSHGILVTSNQFIGFVGTSYATRNPTFDLIYPRNSKITVTGGTETIFAPLSATTTNTSFVFNNSDKQYTIAVNEEGTIDW